MRTVVTTARKPIDAQSPDEVIAGHLGYDGATLPVVGEEWPSYDHVNVQIALDVWFARRGAAALTFQPRPSVQRDALILPDGVVELIERQVLGVARHRDRLRASGQHLKRGLLLYGPPGTGKTHTVRKGPYSNYLPR